MTIKLEDKVCLTLTLLELHQQVRDVVREWLNLATQRARAYLRELRKMKAKTCLSEHSWQVRGL